MQNKKGLLQNWQFLKRFLLLCSACLLTIVWVGTLSLLYFDYRTVVEEAKHDCERMGMALEEHVRRVLNTNEFYLNHMKDEYEQTYNRTPALERLFRQIRLDPILEAGIVDNNGDFVLNTLGESQGINIADVPHFLYHAKNGRDELYIGKPYKGKTSQRLSLHLTKRLSYPNGQFAGVAIIAMKPEYFSSFYQEMNFSRNYTIRFIGLDGVVRASSRESELGSSLSLEAILQQLEEKGVVITKGHGDFLAIQPTEQLVESYRKMQDYPLVIQVGTSQDVLNSYYQHRTLYLLAASTLSICIVLASIFMLFSFRKQHKEEMWLRTFIAHTPIVFYALDSQGKFTLAEGEGLQNGGAHGICREVGASAFAVYKDYPEIVSQVQRALLGETVVGEFLVQDRWWNHQLIPLKDEDGSTWAVVGAALDITERVQVKQKLQENYEQLSATHEELIATEEELREQYQKTAQANQDLASHNALLKALSEVSSQMLAQKDVDRLLAIIISWATMSTGSVHGSVGLLDETKQVIVGLGGVGLFAQKEHLGINLSLTSGIIGEVLRTKEACIVHNYKEWPKRNMHPSLAEVCCFAMVPMKKEERILGVIGVAFTDEKHVFGEKEMNTLIPFAELAAIAVDNAQTMKALAISQKQAVDIFEAAGDGLIVFDGESGAILKVNQRVEELFQCSQKELQESGLAALVQGVKQEQTMEVIQTVIAEGAYPIYERETHNRNGKRVILEVSATAVKFDHKPCCLASLRDITARREAEENAEYLRQRDSMTDVYNRSFFETDLGKMKTENKRNVGILICDVDGLKLINDTLGHTQGDLLLKRVASLLEQELAFPDYVARVGGDEFVVVCFDTSQNSMDELEKTYQKCLQVYNETYLQLPVSLSMGWEIAEDSSEVEQALKLADSYMYRQKIHQSHSVRHSIVQTLMKALEERDHITEGHADRLSVMLEDMGCRLGLPSSSVADLRLFAKFHDMGKVGIPDSILKKPGKLTPDEMKIMQQHCEIGFRIAKASIDLEPISDWILKHHENWDGSGYPLGLAGETIPLQCRILSIVDAYDAMTSDRPYRKAMTKEEAIKELLRCRGSQFEPELVDSFLALLVTNDINS
nr:HD domain-containing phosphohydrolase [uncultured Anaeromusa sp.]